MTTNVICNHSVGCDAELFLFDEEKKKIVNAKPYVKGTKHKPYNFDKSNKFWCTSLDGISAEFNIPPCITKEEFSNNIQKCVDYINSTLPSTLHTIHTCAAYIDSEELKTREAKMFGCNMSYSAYTLDGIEMPSAKGTNLRTCCTHVHVKYDDMTVEVSCELIKAMDLFLGLPSLIIEPDNDRRILYGKLGEFRFDESKTTEYRVLSSFFSRTKELREWVFDGTIKAIDWVNQGNRISDEQSEQFQQVMQYKDYGYVQKLVNDYEILLPQTA